MKRYYQTLSRIGAGLTALAMLAWFLWPRGSNLLDREEALFAFLIATLFWILTEIKESDEVIYMAATKNDIRMAREMVSYASDHFKMLLRDHHFHSSIDRRYLKEASALITEFDVGTAFFQDRRVRPKFEDFCSRLNRFNLYMAQHSSPSKEDRGRTQRIIPDGHHGDERMKQLNIEIDEANRIASEAWDELEKLIAVIKERVPEAFDQPIEYKWFRTKDGF